MTDEAAQRAPMLTLKQVVDRYLSVAPKFGDPVALLAFRLTAEETQNLFSALDEDYHISRFLHFSLKQGQSYLISGLQASHVSIDSTIESIL
jgi:hypothetical protein